MQEIKDNIQEINKNTEEIQKNFKIITILILIIFSLVVSIVSFEAGYKKGTYKGFYDGTLNTFVFYNNQLQFEKGESDRYYNGIEAFAVVLYNLNGSYYTDLQNNFKNNAYRQGWNYADWKIMSRFWFDENNNLIIPSVGQNASWIEAQNYYEIYIK